MYYGAFTFNYHFRERMPFCDFGRSGLPNKKPKANKNKGKKNKNRKDGKNGGKATVEKNQSDIGVADGTDKASDKVQVSTENYEE